MRIAVYSDGDARIALNTLEMAVFGTDPNREGTRVISDDVINEASKEKHCFTIKQEKSITISSRHFTSLCAIVTLTLHCIGWRVCWKLVKIPCMWLDVSSVLLQRMWV